MTRDHSTVELLRDPPVALLVAVELLTALALGATVTALGWQAYQRAHDPLVLGLLGLAEFVPAALLALPAGHVADRHDRRRVAALGSAASVAVSAALSVDAASGDGRVWPLYLLAFGGGCGNAFVAPATGPLLAAAVPASLARAVAVATTAFEGAMIAGPALSGLLQRAGSPAPLTCCSAA